MIGDNPDADIAGARRCGLRAILVRKPHPDITPFAPDLSAVEQILENPG
jgi:FMN phosphatase YigB (HAD superfamily)